MNFMGLGFSFGAKDAGLKSKQKDVAQGFANIAAEVEKMGKRAEGGTAPVAKMTEEISGDKLDKLTASIDQLARSLGKDLPTSAKRGAETMHRSAGNIESDERRIGGGFNFIRDAMEKLNSILRINRLSAFIQSISLARLNDIAHGMEALSGEGTNLTTSFEATLQASNKTARATGANYGLTGKALKRFSSQATSMNLSTGISTDSAAKAVYNYSLAVEELRAVGIKSATDLAKFSEVTGVSADVLVQSLRQARKEFNFSDADLQVLTGSFTAAGQSMGDVGGMLQEMPKVLELVRRRGKGVYHDMDPERMAAFAGQTAAVAEGFHSMGMGAEEARSASLALATTMVEGGEEFSNLFAGTGEDISEFHKALAISGGDTKVAFDTMSQGPGEMMSTMAEMVKKAKAEGKDYKGMIQLMGGQLRKVFGPNQAAMMMTFFETASDAQLDQMKVTSKAHRDLGKIAREGFISDKTLADRFEQSKDMFIKGFRDISRKGARVFVAETSEEFRVWNKKMAGYAAKKGPLGAIIRKMSEMHQLGALSLVPKTLRPMAAVFGTMLKEVTPMVGVLGSLGFRLNMLVSPFALILAAAAVLGGWFLKLTKEGKTTGQAIQHMTAQIGSAAKKLWSVVKKWVGMLFDYLASVDWGAVFTRVFKALADVMKGAGALLRQIPWGKIFKGVLRAIGKIFQFIASEEFRDALVGVFRWLGQAIVGLAGFLVEGFQKAFEALSEVDIGAVVSSIVLTLKQIFQEVGKAIAGVFEKVLDLFEYTASEGFRDRLMKIAQGIATGIKAVFNAMFDLLEGALDYIGNIDMGKAVENVLMTALHFMEAWITMMVAAVETFAARLPSILKKAVGLVIKALIEIPPAIGRFLSKAGDMLQRALPKLVVAILDLIWNILAAIPGLVMKALKAIPDIIVGFGKLIKGAIDLVVKAILGIFQGLEDWLVKKFPKAAGVIHAIFTTLKFVVWAAGEAIKLVIDGIVAVFKFLWTVVGGILKAIWWAFDTFVIKPIKFIVTLIWDALVMAFEGWKAILEVVWGVLEPIFDWLGGVISDIGAGIEWLAGIVGDALGAIGDFFGAIGGALSDAWDAVSDIGSSIGGFFSDIGSGVSNLFGGGGSWTTAMDRVTKKQKEMEAAEKARSAAAAEAARLAVIQAEATVQMTKNQVAHDTRMATQAANHKVAMDKLKLTYTEVSISASNAAAMSKKASDASANGIKDNIMLVDKQVRAANQFAMPKMEESLMKVVEQQKAWNEEWKKSKTTKTMDALIKKNDELRATTMATHGVSASFLLDMQKWQEKQYSLIDSNEEAQKDVIAAMAQVNQAEADAYKERLANMRGTTTAEKQMHQERLDKIFHGFLVQRVEQQKIWRAGADAHNAELRRLKEQETAQSLAAGANALMMIDSRRKLGFTLSEDEIRREVELKKAVMEVEANFDLQRRAQEQKWAGELAQIEQNNLDAHNVATAKKTIADAHFGEDRIALEKHIVNEGITAQIAGLLRRKAINDEERAMLLAKQATGVKLTEDELERTKKLSAAELEVLKTFEQERLSIVGAMHQKFAADVVNISKSVPEEMKSAVESAQLKLQEAYFAQLDAITTNSTLDAKARQEQLDALEGWKNKNLDKYKELTEKATNYTTAAGAATRKGLTEQFSLLEEDMSRVAAEGTTKAAAMAGSVQRELGVSAEEALTNLKDIAAIKPEEFEKNLRLIKKVYIDFAKTAQEQSKLMLTETAKAFDEFNKVAVDHWLKQKGNLTLMMLNQEDIKKLSETVGRVVDQALGALTEMISTKVETAVTTAFIKSFAKVLVETKKFVKDVMVEFRSLADQMVKKFGETWAKILEFTMMAIKAIEADTARAVANLKRIESAMRATAAAKAQTAGGDVKQEAKADAAKTELGNLFQATHHPEWYENDFKYKAMEIIAALNGLAAALAQAPRGGQGGAQSGATSKKILTGLPAGSGGPGASRNPGRRASGGAGRK